MFDNLPPIREIIAKYQLQARKSFGQCFLYDLNLTTKIASFAGDLTDKHVIEIGPGPGGLTRALLNKGAYVSAIEYDKRFAPILSELAQYAQGRLQIYYQDAVTSDYQAILQNARRLAFLEKDSKSKIIANLPYNIGTILLLNWLRLKEWPPFYDEMILMFQKEVAQRITAQPNSKAYGRLTIFANWRSQARILLHLPPQAFTPPPKISSSVVSLIPKKQPLSCNLANLELITARAFQQRRKMLRQSLKGLLCQADLAKADIDGQKRAENLSMEEFVRLAHLLN